MPPPGCPIPDWVYPGRVLMSRQNQDAFVWIDSMRIAEDGTFRIACRRVLLFAPTVVSRFCLVEPWSAMEATYQPTDQWEPHPTFEWEPEMREDMQMHSESCFIVLADGHARSWDIVSTGVEGPNMTLEVRREIDPNAEGHMEPIEFSAVAERQRQLFDLRGPSPGTFARHALPHLMAPPAETIPLDAQTFDRELPPDEVHQLHEAGPDNFMAAAQELHPNDTLEADLTALLDQAEVDPDMRIFTQTPLVGFRRVADAIRDIGHTVGPVAETIRSMGEAIGRLHVTIPAENLPPGVYTDIREGRFNDVSMGAMVPYQLDAPRNNPLWPVWLPYPPQDGSHWELRVRRVTAGSSSILAYPEFHPHDELIWFRDPDLTMQVIGEVQDYPRQGTVPIILTNSLMQVEADPEVLRGIMSMTLPAVYPDPIRQAPAEFLPGQLVSLVGGGLIGTVVAVTPSGVQVHTHDGVNSVVEFEHGALEPYQPPPTVPAMGSILRARNGVMVGRVQRVVGNEVTWATSDGRIFTNTVEDLRGQGGIFEEPNLWRDPRNRQPTPRQPEAPRPTVYDRILEDDDD